MHLCLLYGTFCGSKLLHLRYSKCDNTLRIKRMCREFCLDNKMYVLRVNKTWTQFNLCSKMYVLRTKKMCREFNLDDKMYVSRINKRCTQFDLRNKIYVLRNKKMCTEFNLDKKASSLYLFWRSSFKTVLATTQSLRNTATKQDLIRLLNFIRLLNQTVGNFVRSNQRNKENIIYLKWLLIRLHIRSISAYVSLVNLTKYLSAGPTEPRKIKAYQHNRQNSDTDRMEPSTHNKKFSTITTAQGTLLTPVFLKQRPTGRYSNKCPFIFRVLFTEPIFVQISDTSLMASSSKWDDEKHACEKRSTGNVTSPDLQYNSQWNNRISEHLYYQYVRMCATELVEFGSLFWNK
jgi:hypothetical protein